MIISTTDAKAAPSRTARKLRAAVTLARIAAGTVVAALVLWASLNAYSDPWVAVLLYGAASFVFIIAALSNGLDGGRAREITSPRRAALSRCADTMLVVCALLALAYAALPVGWVVAAVIIVGSDIAVAGLRDGALAAGTTLPVGPVGKWKAAAEMGGVAAALLLQTAALANAQMNLIFALSWGALILLWAAAALGVLNVAQHAKAALRRD